MAVLLVFLILLFFDHAPVNSASNINVHNISASGRGGPILIKNVSAQISGNLARFNFNIENSANYTIEYQGGCFSPMFLLNNAVNLTETISCDAITEEHLASGSAAVISWPYPSYVNLSGISGQNLRFSLILGIRWNETVSAASGIENISMNFSA